MNEETFCKMMYVCESFENIQEIISKMKYYMSIDMQPNFFYQFGKLDSLINELDDRCAEIIEEVNE